MELINQMTEKNAIVFINQNAGYLMIDIINAHEHYKERSIIAGKLVSRNNLLDKAVKFENIITYNRTSSLKRLFTWVWGFIQILWLVKTRYRKSELFIVTNPPFAVFLPLFCSNKYSVLVYDVYPDVLSAYNYLKKDSLIARMWSKANRKIFLNAQSVFTISEGMKRSLSKYAAPEKIEVVPLWADNFFLKPVEKDQNIFIKQYNLQGKFLIIYSGNLGHSHSVEILVEIAGAVEDKDIFFVIIGEGDKKQLISSLIKSKGLENFLLLPWQPVEMLPYTLSAADLAVVTLGKEASAFSVPSKTFSLLSVGAPLLCIADAQSELASLVDHYQAGKCFHTEELEKIISFIHSVKSDKNYHAALKQNAINASKEFGPKNAFKFVTS
jgi:glycosyltransferase involved in cell wall biosynthesis